MPKTPVPGPIAEFLNRPNPAVFASNRPDGQPVSVATWYLFEDGRILVNTALGRKRLEYLETDSRVTLTVLDHESWYSHVSVQGRVVSTEQDPDLSVIDRISQHYTGAPYGARDQQRVSCWIEIDRWHAWGPAAKLAVSESESESGSES
jgi:PPOX class probable F420-dependent enzyme